MPSKVLLRKRIYASIVLGLLLIGALSAVFKFPSVSGGGNWWNSDWSYRKTITVDHTKVDADLTNFPTLINITDTDLKAKAQANGNDIVFTDNLGVKLNHQIEYYSSATGQLVAWVSANLSASSDTILYVYYGNSTTPSQQNKTAVWDSNYKMVQHLSESTGTHYDSTVNGNNGTSYGGVSQGVSGKVDGADNFDGNDDYVNCGAQSSLNFGANIDFTMEAWVKDIEPPAGSEYHRVINMAGGSGNSVSFYTFTDGKLRFIFGSAYGTPTNGTSVRDGMWHYVVAVFDRDSGAVQSWVDGVKQDNVSMSLTGNSATGNVCIGKDPLYTSYPDAWNGTIDEVRISSTIRKTNWISTEYNNQNSPAAFYTVGSEESRPMTEEPQISGVTPTNGATNVDLNPILSVNVVDFQGDLMDVIFSTNASGSWEVIQVFGDVGNGTYSQTTTNMNAYNTAYYWSANVFDHNDHWMNETYSFTTIPYGGVLIGNINYTFEGASLKSLTQLGPNRIGFEIDDSQPAEGSVCWFFFNITKGAYDQTVEFDQLNGDSSKYHRCVYSYDGITWYFFSGSQPTWTHTFTSDSVLIAWIIPFQYSELESYLNTKDALNLPYYNRTIIGHSVEGRNIELVTITNNSIPLGEKRTIWIMTGQHPCEKNSQWQTWYMMDFLLDETNMTAETYRDKYVFKIFPMMNPDGIYHGYDRYNVHLQDLNREWDDGPGNYEPEVDAAFGYIKDWLSAGKDVDVFIDQHDLGGYSLWTIPIAYTNDRVYANVHDLASYYTGHTLYTYYSDTWYSGRSTDALPSQYNITALTSENRPQDSMVTLDVLRKNGLDVLSVLNGYLSDSLDVSSITPINGSISSENPVVFKYNVSSNLHNVVNASLYLNGAYTVSNATPVSTLETNNFTVSLGTGSYTWQVRCMDSIGNIGKSDERVLMVTGDTPYVFEPIPIDGAIDVPISLSQLSFTIADPQHDLMSYTVTTSPNIGADSQTDRMDGTFTMSVSGLSYSTVYTWYVYVSDGLHSTNQSFSFETEREQGAWWDLNWQYRKCITIDHANVASDLAGFPVLIDITDPDVAAHARTDADDIVFTDSFGDKLNFEIESFTSANGHLIAWVNVPDLSSIEDTILYMYYDNPTATGQQNPSGVWDSYYRMIQHFSETNSTNDSTSYNNDGTCYGGVNQSAVGRINGGYSFDGIDDYVDCGNGPSLNFATQVTAEAWVCLKSKSPDSRIVYKYDGSAGWILWYDTDDQYFEFVARAGTTYAFAKFSQSSPSTDTWYHVVGVYDGSTVTIQINGVVGATSPPLSSMTIASTNLSIGREFSGGYMNSSIDEVRVSNIARSNSWITTEYNNQNSPSAFYTIGDEETFKKPSINMTVTDITCRKFNETFTLKLNISDPIYATGFGFEIHYDPALLDVANVFWNAWGTGINTTDEINGIIRGSTSGSPISTNMTLVSITFNATFHHMWKDLPAWTNNQSAIIYVQWANLSYVSGSDLGYVRGGLNQINVGPDVSYKFCPIKGDINNDGTVDIQDLSQIASHYDQVDPVYNLIGDPVVDIFDLVAVASNFWYTYTPPKP